MGKNKKTEREKEVVALTQAGKGTFACLAPGRGDPLSFWTNGRSGFFNGIRKGEKQ